MIQTTDILRNIQVKLEMAVDGDGGTLDIEARVRQVMSYIDGLIDIVGAIENGKE